MSFKARLEELGYTLPPVAKPLAFYVPATVVGNQVWTSGQLPLIDGALPATGKVGAEVSPEKAQELARISVSTASQLSMLRSAWITSPVSSRSGFVSSAPDFTGQPAVINGASDFIGELFQEAGAYARSAVGVAVLPNDAPVELELIVEFAK